jgi:murein DD-endopeptidase MepM/ murein hydrolase activator NlpD
VVPKNIVKILASVDKVLTGIGQLALARPIQSIILLIVAVTITICSNKPWYTSIIATSNTHKNSPVTTASQNTLPLPVSYSLTPVIEAEKPLSADVSEAPPNQTVAPLDQFMAAMIDPTVSLPDDHASLPIAGTVEATLPVVEPEVIAQTPAVATPVAAPKPAAATPKPATQTAPAEKWQVIQVQQGDTLSGLLKRQGFPAKEAVALAKLSGAKALRHLKLGQEMHFYKNTEGQLQQLAYAVSDKSTLNVVRSENGYTATTQAAAISAVTLASVSVAETKKADAPKTESPVVAANTASKTTTASATADAKTAKTTPPVPAFVYASGRITHSLATDARKAGLSPKQVNQLVQIFSPKNLAQSVRPGDEFSILYENAQAKKPDISNKKGKSAKADTTTPSANIVAAQLTMRDKTYKLIRFADPQGQVEYYTPEGYSLRDGLSRQPLNFTYISSYFSSNRLDPVLHYHHPHEGVDFAAPIGTPVQAAGDGVLADMGYKGGYGRMVVIHHDTKYTTRYAHLSKFASDINVGQTVKRGQIIGYVGQSGFATGPHLHYEIRVNDVAANPLTVALPGVSIPAAHRSQFLAQSKVLLAQLNSKQQIWLAERKPTVPQKGRG